MISSNKTAASKQNEDSKGETTKTTQKKDIRLIAGILSIVLMVWFTLLLISYLFNGEYDYSLVQALAYKDLDQISGETSNICGSTGAWMAHLLINEWFGVSIFFLLAFGWIAALKLLHLTQLPVIKSFLLLTFCMIWASVTLSFLVQPLIKESFISVGGDHGLAISKWLTSMIGWPGTLLVVGSTMTIILVIVRISQLSFFKKIGSWKPFQRKQKTEGGLFEQATGAVSEEFDQSWTGVAGQEGKSRPENRTHQFDYEIFEEDQEEEDDENTEDDDLSQDADIPSEEPPVSDDLDFEVNVAKGDDSADKTEEPLVKPKSTFKYGEEEYDASELGEYDPRLDLSSYKFPVINLLTKYETNETIVNPEEQKSNKRRIQDVLEQFSIKISSISATVGPTVTLYEIIPEPGVRISRIKSLENDIALSLAALGIRIIAPIPGKGTIGIEVPNRDPQVVSMFSVVSSKKFQESKFDLPMVLGRTITNDIFMVDLCKMPHVLVAGATGQGKSVGLNAMITSLLYKKHPAELKFVMVDPKMVEFSVYSAIEKHFLAKLPDDGKPIITDSDKVKQTLNSLTREMDDRYNLLMLAGVRNVKEYNAKFVNRHLNPEKGHKYLPYIVVIIDEFGDLIMTAGKEIEMPIARIAQKARAVGIHMIIATQRPTTNIITGTIKANFPSRVAFRVSSGIDSRTILDALGANQLIGRGDMLFSQGSDLVRVQCAFVDTPEVVNIVRFISEQKSYPTPFYLPEPTNEGGGLGPAELEGIDPLFEDAARLIVIHQQGSTSLIQRKFSIGYNRAGRIVDQLEQAGIIGPSEGSKARQVLVADEVQLDAILSRIK